MPATTVISSGMQLLAIYGLHREPVSLPSERLNSESICERAHDKVSVRYS